MPSSHRGLPVEAAAPIIAKSSCQELILPWKWKLSSLASFKKKLSLGAILQSCVRMLKVCTTYTAVLKTASVFLLERRVTPHLRNGFKEFLASRAVV